MSNCHHQHIARTDFPSDEHLRSLSDADCPWPSPARARFLVGIALKGLGRCYHIVRRSSVLAELDYITRSNTSPGFLSKSKLWVLFAIGEIYATRSSVRGKEFPGIRYFAQAMRVLSVVSERPHCDLVEIWLLLVSARSPAARSPTHDSAVSHFTPCASTEGTQHTASRARRSGWPLSWGCTSISPSPN